MAALAYIALGSNLGDRGGLLDQAIQKLSANNTLHIRKVSTYYETQPVGGPPGQGLYLNAATELETDFEPEKLLDLLQDIEEALGRVRAERFGPRTIDLDILLYNDLICESEKLTVPHPRMQERLFVLEPLTEIAPRVIHPVLGRSMRQLLLEERARQAPPGRELTGLRAMVTGSSSGIGRAIAMELARAGAKVLIHRRGSLGGAAEVVGEAQSLGVQAAALQADLRDPDACHRLVETAWAYWGGVDIWINNAGADTLTGPAAQWSFERKLQELLAVDITATVLISRAIGERMRTLGSGVILNMGWDQAETGMEGESGQLFAAAKGAVIAFSKSLALTLAPDVRVNCLAPGWIRTRWGENASKLWQESVKRETPLQRWGSAEDVATVARWLAAPSASYITGQTIRINGGAVR